MRTSRKMRKMNKAKIVSEATQQLEFLIDSELRENGIQRRDLLEHSDHCVLCHAVLISCPFCNSKIPFAYQCPECKKVLPLQSLVEKLSETIASRMKR
jgi:hypothetical protein